MLTHKEGLTFEWETKEDMSIGYPTVNIILDSRRHEKYEPLMEVLRVQDIKDYTIWPCLLLPNVVSSINASHKMIVRDAKEKKLSEVCIWEDDCYFPAVDGWPYFLYNKPEKFNIYSACNYVNRDHPTTKELVGLHCYIISESFYDTFLNLGDNLHIDTALSGSEVHICYPYAALQRPGFSANNMAITNYNSILNEKDVYGKFK